MYIQNNLAALNAHRTLTINNNKSSKKIEKLSGGKKINRSADDAAGLAISEKMRAQIRGMSMAQKNAQDGVSLIQTAEGALSVTQDLLHRMRELAVQSSSDVNDEMDRKSLNVEYQHLMEEIDEIAGGAAFNGIKLFDGSLASVMPFQSETYTLEFSATQQPTSPIDWSTVESGKYAGLANTIATEIVPEIIANMAAALPGLGEFFNSDISIGMSYSRDGTSGSAYASVSYGWGLSPDYVRLNLNINLDQVDASLNASGAFLDEGKRSKFEAVITHEITHALMAVTSTVGMASPDRYPLWFIEGAAQAMGGDNGWIAGTLGSSPTDAQIENLLKYSELTSGSTQSLYASGYLATMYLAWKAADGADVTSSNLATGMNKILSQLADGKSLDQVIKDNTGGVYSGLDDFQKYMATKQETKDFVKNLISATGSGLGAVLGSDLNDTDIVDNPGSPTPNTFLAVDTSNQWVINMYPTGYSPGNGGGAYTNGNPIDSTAGPTYVPGSGGYGSSASGPLTFHVGPNTADTISMSISQMNTKSLGIKHPFGFVEKAVSDTSIENHAKASAAIEVCDGAIKMVSNQRADLGSIQNRLEFRARGLGISEENLTNAESRIRDSDMAEEMTGFVKSDILTQASQSMLAQANSLPQAVLSLING